MSTAKDTVGLAEAAVLLHLSPTRVCKLAAAGLLPGAKIGRRWVFLHDDIVGFARPARKPPTAANLKLRAQRAERFSWHRASRRKRVPAWADRRVIASFYRIARRASACTGLCFSVDHVLPMHGKTVSGLHVPENLRVLPRYINQSKSNRI